MENATSCAPVIINGNGATKVLRWDGKLDVYARLVKATELMLENPGQFLCDAATLQVGHRISRMLADDDLERRQLYFLLPMDILYLVLTHEEVSHLNYKAYKALKPGSFNNLGKIFPLFSDFCLSPSVAKRLESDSLAHVTEPDISIRVSCQRSWRPALETIVEAS